MNWVMDDSPFLVLEWGRLLDRIRRNRRVNEMALDRFFRALLFMLATTAAGCGQGSGDKRLSSDPGQSPGVTVLPALPTESPRAGRTVYVPICSFLQINDDAKRFNLAATVYVRNTDPKRPIFVKSVDYHASSGKLIRSFLKSPIRLDPLASTSFFVPQSDTTGGPSPSFLVEWLALDAVNAPVVEAVMMGTLVNQGVTLTSQGRELAVTPAP